MDGSWVQCAGGPPPKSCSVVDLARPDGVGQTIFIYARANQPWTTGTIMAIRRSSTAHKLLLGSSSSLSRSQQEVSFLSLFFPFLSTGHLFGVDFNCAPRPSRPRPRPRPSWMELMCPEPPFWRKASWRGLNSTASSRVKVIGAPKPISESNNWTIESSGCGADGYLLAAARAARPPAS
jgi:hypothetical protein